MSEIFISVPLCALAAPKSEIDQLLEELQVLVHTTLPIIGPKIGLTPKEVLQVINLFDKFVDDVEALEHGQVPVPEGLEAMLDDVLEILMILDVDWTFPSKCLWNGCKLNSALRGKDARNFLSLRVT